MHIQLAATNFEIGPHLKELVSTKFEPQLQKHLGSFNHTDLVVNLHISKDKDGLHTVTSSLDLPGHGGQISGQSESIDLVLALKKVLSQLQKQISRFKEH